MNDSPVDEVTSIVQPTTVNYDARMRYRGIGDLMFPGICCVCGSGTREEGYVDIGVYYEYEGQMYLCLTCLTEAAETGGMLSLEVSNELKRLATQIAEDYTKLAEQYKEAKARLEHYDSLFSNLALNSPSDSVGDSNVSDPNDEQAVEGDAGTSDGDTVSSTDEGKQEQSEPVKSGSVKVTKRVSSSTGSNDSK